MPVLVVLQRQHPQNHDVHLPKKGTIVTDQGARVVQPCLVTARQWVAQKRKRKDYAFWRQFDEKPSTILGCPVWVAHLCQQSARF